MDGWMDGWMDGFFPGRPRPAYVNNKYVKSTGNHSRCRPPTVGGLRLRPHMRVHMPMHGVVTMLMRHIARAAWDPT